MHPRAVHPEEMGSLYPSVPEGSQPPPVAAPASAPIEMRMPSEGVEDLGNDTPVPEQYAQAEPVDEIKEADMQAPPGIFTNHRGNLKVRGNEQSWREL